MSNRKASAQDGNWEAAAAATRTSLRPICSLLRAAALTAHCPSSLCTCSHELTQAYVHTDKTAHLVFAHNAQSHGQQRILLLPTQSLQANTGSYKHICSHRQDCPPSPCTSYKCIPAMQVLQSLHVCSHRQHYPPNPCTKIPIERRSCTYH